MAPHLLIRPSNWTLNLPDLPSSMNSNSPMYPLSCRTRRTCPNSLEAGLITHEVLFRNSLFINVVNPLDKTSFAVKLLHHASLIFLKSQLLRNLSETVAAYVQTVPANDWTVRTASSTRSTAFAVFAFSLRLLFNHSYILKRYVTWIPNSSWTNVMASSGVNRCLAPTRDSALCRYLTRCPFLDRVTETSIP